MQLARITSFSGPYRFLSNFWPATVYLDGVAYPSVEHAYQAAKTLDPKWREDIRTAIKPSTAKALGDAAPRRPEWETIKLDTMLDLLVQKFAPGTSLARRLLETGEATLVEGNWWGDTFWGVCRGKGTNHLGRLLMQVRAALREMGDKPTPNW